MSKQLCLTLDGLNCGHCASVIEEKLNTLENIEKVNFIFIKKELKIDFIKDINKDEKIAEITKLIQNIEADIKVSETPNNTIKPILLNIKGLECGHCASVIEEKLNTLPYIKEASLNFIKKELKIIFNTGIDKSKGIKDVITIIDNIESGLIIKQITKNTTNDIKEDDKSKFHLIKILIGVLLLISGKLLDISFLYVLSYALLGYDVIIKALKNIKRGQIFDENFLMAIATFGAFLIGEHIEGIAIMLFYQIGEFFQQKAVSKSRDSIKSLVQIKAEYATKINGDIVDPEDLIIGDIILVKVGEKIPVDGEVIEGKSFLDMSALIGESVPRSIDVGQEVLSGSINNSSVLKIKVTKNYENSTVYKILELVENSYSKKSKAENFISKFAKVYTPIVVIIAFFLAIIPPLFTGFDFVPWIRRSLVFLVSSCPCALVVSVPLSFFSGIGCASKKGILIKGSMYMQSLASVDTIVFDKTGTLTKGVFNITKINTVNISERNLLDMAYFMEKLSIHPVAKSIVNYYENNFVDILDIKVSNLEEISGYGLKGEINGETILIGNGKLLDKFNVPYEKCTQIGTIVYIAKNNKFMGYILVSDIIKNESKEAIDKLKSIGIKNTIILSGDKKEVAQFVANEVGINTVYAELLPQDKVYNFEQICKNNTTGKVAFVGDGINDAPVLAISDVGFAMGGVGSDIAIETADCVIMNDNLNKIYDAILISKQTMTIVKNNVIFSLIIKFIVLGLAIFGFANIWLAVFADVGVTIIAILNAMKLQLFDKLKSKNE